MLSHKNLSLKSDKYGIKCWIYEKEEEKDGEFSTVSLFPWAIMPNNLTWQRIQCGDLTTLP